MAHARLDTIRAFEHAGWEAAASQYERLFAGATKHYVEPLLEGTHTSTQTHLLDVACGQRTASTTLLNSANIPSPVFLTTRPRCSATLGSTRVRRWSWSWTCVPSSSRPVNRL